MSQGVDRERESTPSPMGISTTDNSKEILKMESEGSTMLISQSTMANGTRAVSMEKACSFTQTRMFIQGNGWLERSMAKGPMCSMRLE